MRLTANFTLHAILAACLAALAASSAAAGKPAIDNEGHVYLSGALLGGSASKDGGQHLEVHSYQWGTASQAYLKYKLDPVYVKSWSTSGDADAPPPSGGGNNEMRMEDSAGGGHQQSRSGHSMLGASERVTVGGSQTESGQATGKRQHQPLIARGYYDQATPPPRGTLTILASASACRVGARYPSLTLDGRGKSYLLQNLQIVECTDAGPQQQVTFVYGKVTVRGWDPEKKEQ
jgi:type VI protein secretion system component Hcp